VRFAWVLLIVLGLLTFHNLFGSGFVGDDYDQVVHNEAIRSLRNAPAFFAGSTFYSGGGNQLGGTYYRPVMMSTFALIYHFWSSSAPHFHILLVGLCILNSILAFFFFRSFFTPLVSLAGAALFLLHPLNSEVVAYISDYQDALFLLFGLLALNIEIHRNSTSPSWFVAEFVCLLLSALSKETGLLFLPALILFNLWVRRYNRPTLATNTLYGAVIAAALVYGCLRIFVGDINAVQAHHTPIELAPFAIRLLNMPAVVFYYLKNFFFPWPLGLAQHWIHRTITFEGFILPLVGIAVFAAFAFATVRRFGTAGMFFLTFWVMGVALHVHIVPLDSTVADRWHYLASLPLIGLFLLWIEGSFKRPHARYYAGALVGLFILGFGIRTYIRSEDWADEEKLLSRDLLFQPDSFAIMSQLGYIYLDQKQYTEACSLLEKSVMIAPNWWVNTNNLAVCYYNVGRLKEAETYFRKSLENGRYYLAYENLATLLIQQRRYAEAREFIKNALTILPNNRVLPRLLWNTRNEPN
jgi:hypothetical protein